MRCGSAGWQAAWFGFAFLRRVGEGQGSFPESERAARETLALPIFPELSREQLQYVVDCIASFYS